MACHLTPNVNAFLLQRCRHTSHPPRLLLSSSRLLSFSSSSSTRNRKQHGQLSFTLSATSSSKETAAAAAAAATFANKKVAIVGGGMAGLSTAFHLLRKTRNNDNNSHSNNNDYQPCLDITVFDTHPVGTGGASSVAGGLLHPLSPSGKLVYLGLEGLNATNQLLDAACRHYDDDDDDNRESKFNTLSPSSSSSSTAGPSTIVLQDCLYRVALSLEQQSMLQSLAITNREQLEASQVYCQWLSPDELNMLLDESGFTTSPYHQKVESRTAAASADAETATGQIDANGAHFGALKLSGNAKVIHVPSYLRGLWNACLHLSDHTCKWTTLPSASQTDHGSNDKNSKAAWLESLQNEFDVVILSAGAGLFQPQQDVSGSILSSKDFPIQLVRGQSIEMQRRVPPALSSSSSSFAKATVQRPPSPALVCGKYVLPTPHENRIMIGATHEFQANPWSLDQVIKELRERTTSLIPFVWEQQQQQQQHPQSENDGGDDDDWMIADVISGVRVQSHRGAHGRLPIIGHLQSNVWIFTGLSSRGLLYHGLFGDYLTDAVLASCLQQEVEQQELNPSAVRQSEWDWWKGRK